jgi:hypothetical protein
LKFPQKLFLLAFAGTILAVFWQEFNSSYLDVGGEPRFGLVSTADDASYLAPPKNFIEKGVWADNSQGLSRYFQRPPGYGMIFGLFHFLLGKYALLGMKIMQICLYFLTLFLTGKTILHLSKSEKWALTGTAVMAVLPMYSGFIYYSLTEALTPFLLIWSIYSFLSSRSIFNSTVPLALLLLVRPQLLIFPLALFTLALIQKAKRKMLFIAASFIPFFLWMMRTTYIAREFPGIHPIYSDTNISLYRPGHAAMTDLFRVWESDGEVFHQTIACINGTKDDKDLVKCSTHIPSKFQEKVVPLMIEFHQLLHRPDYARSIDFKNDEKDFVQRVNKVRKELIAMEPTTHYFLTPIKSALYLLSKSHLNLTIFQEKFRGNSLMELVRLICILTINLGMLSLIIQLFKRRSIFLQLLSAAMLCYFFYLIYFQRMNEERYLTPLLPVLLIILIITLQQLGTKKMDPSKGSI